MPSYFPVQKGQPFVFYLGLPDAQDPDFFKLNPTLASGDAQVSTDGAALQPLATIPSVVPVPGKLVKVSLSAAEMNGDNISVVLSDQQGGEWGDVIVNIQTADLTAIQAQSVVVIE